MTCIIGLKRDGKVYLGADSMHLCGWHRYRVPQPKIFRVGKMLIGTSGEQRVSDILQYNLIVEQEDMWTDNPADYIVQAVIPVIREALREHGAMMSDEGRDGIESSDIMIGYRGSLFIIGEDFSLSEIETYEAIGAGAKYALGYMYAAGYQDPIQAIEGALECAAWFSASCAGPYVVEKL